MIEGGAARRRDTVRVGGTGGGRRTLVLNAELDLGLDRVVVVQPGVGKHNAGLRFAAGTGTRTEIVDM